MRVFLILCAASALCRAQDAQALFAKHCATCHQPGSETRAPLPSALKLLCKEKILASLETGAMKAQGSALTAAERMALASHLSAPNTEAQPQAGLCPAAKFSMSPGEAGWTGWGVDAVNSRFQSAQAAGLDRANVARPSFRRALR